MFKSNISRKKGQYKLITADKYAYMDANSKTAVQSTLVSCCVIAAKHMQLLRR